MFGIWCSVFGFKVESEMARGSLEDLEVWQRSCSLAVEIYDVLENRRDLGLKDQMTRAAVSFATGNFAEGAEHGSAPDFIHVKV